jgi:hypothetical protein
MVSPRHVGHHTGDAEELPLRCRRQPIFVVAAVAENGAYPKVWPHFIYLYITLWEK